MAGEIQISFIYLEIEAKDDSSTFFNGNIISDQKLNMMLKMQTIKRNTESKQQINNPQQQKTLTQADSYHKTPQKKQKNIKFTHGENESSITSLPQVGQSRNMMDSDFKTAPVIP